MTIKKVHKQMVDLHDIGSEYKTDKKSRRTAAAKHASVHSQEAQESISTILLPDCRVFPCAADSFQSNDGSPNELIFPLVLQAGSVCSCY
ncbi:hypothetical protein ILYODFUR_032514 [Ilyodon furcidens]|uniref:Uncharacterized protein n=1 Tax=Ilyodon furcidens TaxID=33524 RepID=A0ABV0UBI6_9TELE